jgi:ribose transport system ATP-binding protein
LSNVVLDMNQIDKKFSGVHALKSVSLDLRESEVLALVGENGAGKSTLMKILTGIYQKDHGEIRYLGEYYNPRNPKHAMDLGLGIIHQELNMMDHLSVADNIFIGRESMKSGGLFLDKREQNRRAEELFSRLNMNIDPRERLGNLTVGKQQMVEIAKAVSHNLKVLILDEPSAALTEREINDLFTIMRDLQSKGVSMIYISHRLEEIHQISNRTTVIRDGEVVGTNDTSEISKQDIINMMVGRAIYEEPKAASTVKPGAPVALSLKNVNAGPQVRDINFDLHRGEILGFAGLIGAGRTETARVIFGADPIDSGYVELNGSPVKISDPRDAVAKGIGYLSEDRKRYGLAINLDVRDNMMLSSYNLFSKHPFVPRKLLAEKAEDYVGKLKIKTPSIFQLIRNLSGGNQQKVVLAKWLIRDSEILIFDEPTRGIDVGAKSEIYHLMNELAGMGKSIIMISSELPEILRMSDRVAVMCEGRITGILDIENASQEKIMELATMRESAVTKE